MNNWLRAWRYTSSSTSATVYTYSESPSVGDQVYAFNSRTLVASATVASVGSGGITLSGSSSSMVYARYSIFDTTVLGWFMWNGKPSNENFINVLSQPSFTLPSERATVTPIPGRSGALTLLEGDDVYDELSLSCSCVISDLVQNGTIIPSQIGAWLKGNGEVTFASRSDGYYKARVSNQISLEKVLRDYMYHTFSVQFRCSPFLYLNSGETPTIITLSGSQTSKTQQLNNLGNVFSKPLIEIHGTGDGIRIGCGGSELEIDLSGNAGYIMIDCESMQAYKGILGSSSDPLTPMNNRVSGDLDTWLSIPTNEYSPSLSINLETAGTMSELRLYPKWRVM